jgi:hypothetical protein
MVTRRWSFSQTFEQNSLWFRTATATTQGAVAVADVEFNARSRIQTLA